MAEKKLFRSLFTLSKWEMINEILISLRNFWYYLSTVEMQSLEQLLADSKL